MQASFARISSATRGSPDLASPYRHGRKNSVRVHVLARDSLDKVPGVHVGVLAGVDRADRREQGQPMDVRDGSTVM